MSRSIILIALLTLALSSELTTEKNDPSPPFWGGNPTFTVNVSFLYNDPVMTWDFTYHYNWNLKAERYEHHAPQADEMCLLANPPFTKNDSCVVVFAKDGWSYVQYPQKNWCCKCGNAFGGVRYDWLQTNTTYQGQETVSGYVTQHWTKNGQFLNHYYNTIGGLPVKFHELKGGKPKDWNFDLKSYTKTVNDSKFQPLCTNLCTGDCKHFRRSFVNEGFEAEKLQVKTE